MGRHSLPSTTARKFEQPTPKTTDIKKRTPRSVGAQRNTVTKTPVAQRRSTTVKKKSPSKKSIPAARPVSSNTESKGSFFGSANAATVIACVCALLGVVLAGISWGWATAGVLGALCLAAGLGYWAVYTKSQEKAAEPSD